jgi:hypothetical protein
MPPGKDFVADLDDQSMDGAIQTAVGIVESSLTSSVSRLPSGLGTQRPESCLHESQPSTLLACRSWSVMKIVLSATIWRENSRREFPKSNRQIHNEWSNRTNSGSNREKAILLASRSGKQPIIEAIWLQ